MPADDVGIALGIAAFTVAGAGRNAGQVIVFQPKRVAAAERRFAGRQFVRGRAERVR